MKKSVGVLLIFALLVLAMPYAALPARRAEQAASVPSIPPAADAAPQDAEAPLAVLDTSTGRVLTIPVREFLIGAVAGELPVSYQQEAFRAQVVAVHSYALASKALQLANPDAALKGAYLSVDATAGTGYLSEALRRSLWGESYDTNTAYVSSAVDAVLHEILLYDGAPALTTYYAISNGSTQASEAVWRTALPYLIRVEMPLDKTAPDYEVTEEFSAQEMADALRLSFTALDLSGSPADWFGVPERDAAGYVATVSCGGQVVKGTEIRAALGLRSADFTIVCDADNRFSVTTRGYGHGVGMSQYAANVLAVAGHSHAEILAQFYPGTTLGSLPAA